MKTNIIIKTIAITFILALCSCEKKNKSEEDKSDFKENFAETVKTYIVSQTSEEKDLILSGLVSYDLDNVVDYIALSNGIIEKSQYHLGQKVVKGQVLLDLRSSELNGIQAEVTAADAELRVAQKDYESAQELFHDNMISHKELLEAEGAMRQAKAEVQKLSRDMSLYGGGNSNGLYSIKSPIDGYVVQKETGGKGSVVSEGDELFKIADLGKVWVIANIYAGNLGSVREGMPVQITSVSYPNEVFNGFIDAISPIFDPEEKVVKAIIKLDNTDFKLKPDMAVSVKVKDVNETNNVAVPSDALIFDNNKYFVIIETEKGKYEMEEVKVLNSNSGTSYIQGNVKVGDKIVISTQLLIFNKLKSETINA